MKNFTFFLFIMFYVSLFSQNTDRTNITSLEVVDNIVLPEVDNIKPNQIIVYDKGYTKKLYEFEVHYVFEEEIYAKWENQIRMRVIAFLYPKVVKEYETVKVYVLGFSGDRIDSSRPPSAAVFSTVVTSNYSIIGKKQSSISYSKIGFGKQNLTKHISLRHPSHLPYEVFWGYGLTDSTVLGNYNNKVYRVDSILLPAILSETDIDTGGVGIRCFAHDENNNGPIEFIKGMTIQDSKILSVIK